MMKVAVVCDPPDAVLVHKPRWVADGFRAAGHSATLVHDLAGVRVADATCDLVLFDHKASGTNRAALAELARQRRPVADFVRSLAVGAGHSQNSHEFCYAACGDPVSAARRSEKGDGYVLPERPEGCFAQNVPVPFFRRAVWVQWWRDLVAMDPGKRLAEQDHLRSFGPVMRGMDIVFVKEQSLLDEYRQLGINAHWLDQACPADMPACEHPERETGDGYVLPERPEGCFAQNVPVPFAPRPEWDVLVLGSTGYAQRRADARALADAGYRVLWAGMASSDPVPPGVEWHPWLHPFKLPELASRCGVVLGVDWRSDLPGYTSDRTYLACGMGACYVARYTDCGSAFPPASYAPQAALAAWIYESTDQLIEIVRLAMSDAKERRRRGEQSRRRVMERHTYAHRASEIVELITKCRTIV